MLVWNKFLFVALSAFAIACAPRKTNVEKALVDQVITEFTYDRIMHHLRGNGPKSNEEFFDRVLKRHSVRMLDFSPAFKRYSPEVYSKLLGTQAAVH